MSTELRREYNIRLIALFPLLLLAYFYSVADAKGNNLDLANEIYVKSGLEKHLQDISPSLLAGYKNNYSRSKHHSAYGKKIYQNIDQVIERTFDVHLMKERVVTGLAHNISDKYMEQILAWLNSPGGQRITELEEHAASIGGVRQLQDYMRKTKEKNVPLERSRLIEDLNSSMNITETTLNITLSMQFALSMTTIEKAQKEFSHDDIRNLYEDFYKNNRSQVEQMLGKQVHGTMFFTYQALTDEELGDFLQFAQSDSGKQYSHIISGLLIQEIVESSLQFVMEVSRL